MSEEKRDYSLTISKEEQKETSFLINAVIDTLSKQAAKMTETFHKRDPNTMMFIFEHLLQNFLLNLLNRTHTIEEGYCFDIMNAIDEELQRKKDGTKKTKAD